MSDETNWAQVDKRIRQRKPMWTKEEKAALEAGLNALPDMAEQYEVIELAQPAIGNGEEEEPAAEAEGEQAAPQAEVVDAIQPN